MTFTYLGERLLSEWMSKNIYVTWIENDRPWEIEKLAIAELSLPLNLQDNSKHTFYSELSMIRSEMKQKAKVLPIVAR